MAFGDFNVNQYWNAATNQPPIKSGVGIPGLGYRVKVAGSTTLDGITSWNVGDIAVFVLDTWLKIAANASVSPLTSIKNWGLKGDGVTDDSAAWISFCATVPDGSSVYIPSGNYLINNAGTITNKSIILQGAGSGLSNLIFGAVNGLTINVSSYFNKIEIHDLSFLTTQVETGTALTIVRPVGAASAQKGPIITGCEFTGLNPFTQAWVAAINLTQGWNAHIHRCVFSGIPSHVVSNGIILNTHCTAVNITECEGYYLNTAVYMPPSAYCEGLNARDNQWIYVNYGFYLDDSYAAGEGIASLVQINGGHINSLISGVYVYDRPDVIVSGVDFFKNPSSSANWVGVTLGYCEGAKIQNNVFRGFKGSTAGGAAVAATGFGNSHYGMFTNNTVHDCDQGVNGSNTWDVVVANNIFHNVTTPILALGTNGVTGTNWTMLPSAASNFSFPPT